MNIDDYFTFEDPNELVPNPYGGDPSETQALHEQDIASIRSALEEIASTPEGRQMIKDAAANDPDGKINIMGNPDGFTAAYKLGDEENIGISGKDAVLQYRSPETGEWHDLSIQRMLVEELQHKALGHDGITVENEAEAKTATNEYMEKYYDEPPQDTGYQTQENLRIGGTDQWDYNQNFQRQGASLEIELPEGPFNAITASDEGVVIEVAEAGANVAADQLPRRELDGSAPTVGPQNQTFDIA
ncbi:MAG: hypothetical protein AAGB32_04830 [Pseudomonadota bacterium]